MFCCLRNRRPNLGNLAAYIVVQTKGFRIDDCGETRSVLKGGGGVQTRGPPMSSEVMEYPPPHQEKRGSGARLRNIFLCMDAKY